MKRFMLLSFTSFTFLTFAGDADALRMSLARTAKDITVQKGSIPGCVVADGEKAIPLAVGKSHGTDAAVAAASVYGKGRVVAVTHHAFFEKDSGIRKGNLAFLRECLTWLARDASPEVIYIDARCMKIRPMVELAFGESGNSVQVRQMGRYEELASMPKNAVVITIPDSHPLSAAKKLSEFVGNGGGVMAEVVGWGWHQISRGKSFSTESPFNAAFGPAGIYTGNALVYAGDNGVFKVPNDGDLAGSTAKSAMEVVDSGAAKAAVGARSLFTLDVLDQALPPEDKTWRPRLDAFKNYAMKVIPSPEHPLDSSRIRERLAFILFQNDWLRNPDREWAASAAAAVYPGIPEKGTSRVTREVAVDLSVPRWHGTSLFAAAGEPFTVTLPEGAEKKGLRVRVGSTTCRLTGHNQWKRAPVVDVELPLTKRTTTFSSPFGGLIYIVVPRSLKGNVSVKIGPACPAPRFVEGRDTPETWAAQLRCHPAPFAEIESDHIVLIVPYANAKTLADPRPLLNVWREIMDNDAYLTGIPAKRPSPERICLDVQLCAGYMHSGYPIMLPMVSGRHLVSEPTIRKGAQDDVWGFFHEMGHNHQNGDWTFDGTGEVTVNFFSLYNMEKICGRTIRQNTKIGGEGFRRKVERWNAAGRPKDQWLSDPFLALDFFARLVERYGWESFVKLFAEYRALPQSERPKTDLEKRQQWCRRLSRIVGEDLTNEFQFLLK